MKPLTDPALSIKDLTFTLNGQPLIESASLTIDKGEVVLLCGRSGSGKSTLANLINGYFPEYGGKQTVSHIRIDGEDVQLQSVVDRSEKVGTIFQNARLSFSMKTLREEMGFCLENTRTPSERIDDIIEQKATHFNLTHLLDRSFDDLSGGELQKAAFVCANLSDLPLYIMDEPFANMDEQTIEDYVSYIKVLSEQGKAVIIIDHHVDRWNWVGRWLLMDTTRQLIDLTHLPSDFKRDKLIEAGVVIDPAMISRQRPNADETVLELDKVSVYHEQTVRQSFFRKVTHVNTLIEEASFELKKGALTALVGPSGIGKSSLFRSILNVSPYSGDIRIQGKSIRDMKSADLYSRIGLVFQDPSLQFVKTKVMDEMVLSLTAWDDIEEEVAAEQAKALLEHHHFDNKADESPWVLSQGQQRRLAVVCMTVGQQQLLLVDEPTYGQDAANARKIMDKLSELCEAGMTCLFTSHDRQLVDAYADTIYEIREKKVKQVL